MDYKGIKLLVLIFSIHNNSNLRLLFKETLYHCNARTHAFWVLISLLVGSKILHRI